MRGGSRRRHAAGGVLLVALVTALTAACSVGPASNRAARMDIADQPGQGSPTRDDDGDGEGDGLPDYEPDDDPTTSAPPEKYEAASDNGTIDVSPFSSEGIANPCCLTALSNGDVLVGTTDGVIYRVSENSPPIEAGELHSVALGGDRMLLGLAVEPDATDDVTVYAYYSRGDDSRIGTYVYDEDEPEGDQLTPSNESMVEGLPAGVGGALAFDLDGNLTASAGTEVLRMTSTGDAPDDNPDPASRTYASGFSDVQGLAWDPSGRLWAIDAGDGTASSPPTLKVVERDSENGIPGLPMPVGDPLDLNGQPTGLAYGGDSHPFWMTTDTDEGVWRIPPDGEGDLVTAPTRLPDSAITTAQDLIPGADANTLLALTADGRVLQLTVT